MEIEVKGEEVFLYESKSSAVRRDMCCLFRHISVCLFEAAGSAK